MSSQSLCKAHRAAAERERGTRQQRGYGPAHDALRRAWRIRIDRYGASCARCGGPIPPFAEFNLDHSEDRTYYLGPSHPVCNMGNRPIAETVSATESDNDLVNE